MDRFAFNEEEKLLLVTDQREVYDGWEIKAGGLKVSHQIHEPPAASLCSLKFASRVNMFRSVLSVHEK